MVLLVDELYQVSFLSFAWWKSGSLLGAPGIAQLTVTGFDFAPFRALPGAHAVLNELQSELDALVKARKTDDFNIAFNQGS